MPLLKILIFPDPRLRTVAKAVEKVDDSLKKLTEDMLETFLINIPTSFSDTYPEILF